MKKSLKLVAVAASLTLITGVAVAPTAQAAKIKLCLALDTGGVDDRSFNASAWAGAKASKVATAEYLPAASSADYAPNIKTFVDKGCELIIGVGYLTTSAIKEAAIANPKVKFAIIDDVIEGVSNAKSITFQTDEAAFMAGYLAAGMSKTKKVATYGGMAFPSVTIFMNGFARGFTYWNKQNAGQVKVLGWDPAKPDAGVFVGNFADSNKALQISNNFEQQGADIILPVGGVLGASYAAASEKSTKKSKPLTIWVDSDGYNTLPAGKSVLLTTVLKEIGASVQAVAADVAAKKFTNAKYVGTLKNKGVALAPYHDLDKKVPAKLKSEILKIKGQIIKGTLDITANK